MEPADDRVRELTLALERDILDAVARALPLITGLLAIVTVHEWQQGRMTRWMLIELAVTACMAVGVLRRWSHGVRATTLPAGLNLLAVCAMFAFGPLMGTGLFFAAAALASIFFFGARGGVVAVGVLFGAIGAGLLGAVPEASVLETGAWTRLALSSTITLGYLSYFFYRLLMVTRGSLESEVSALRRQEANAAEHEQLLRAAEASERLDSLGRMAGGVAHDFNNALQVIQMGVGVLRTREADPRSEALLAEIDAASRSAAATVRELLTFSRQAPQPVGRCAPTALISRIQPTLQRALAKHATLVVEGDYPGEVAVAESELEQVVLSLVFNARDALPVGGHVCVRMATGDSGALVLCVEDDGRGMDAQTRARIFEPFFSTRGAQGTGLGLATVWGIVTRAGGHIEVESEVGAGARFTVRLPGVD